MATIEQRLHVLECQFRRTRRFNRVLLFVLMVVVCIAGAQRTTPPDSKQKRSKSTPQPDGSEQEDRVPPAIDRLRTVKAGQFVLVDRLGRSRATMVVTDHGPALCMFDEKGQKKLELSQAPNGSGLHLFGSNESVVASLQVPRDVAGAHLKIRSSQGSSSMKSSGVSVQDSAEKQRLILALINGNFPVLGISQSGQRGPSSVQITASDDGSRRLKMHDSDGYPLFSVFTGKSSTTYLNMGHPDHERSLQISSGAKELDGPEIAFFAPTKKDGTGGILPYLRFGLRKDRQPFIRIVDDDGSPLFTAPTK